MTVIFPKQEEDNTHRNIIFFFQKLQQRRKTGMFKLNKGTITATETGSSDEKIIILDGLKQKFA
jgi:hypothetical protein